MVIDTKKCIGCGDCVIACKTENSVPDGLQRDWIVEETSGKFPLLHMEIRSERCNHCKNPPCVDTCPAGASFIKSGTNITLVNPDKCTGCKACIAACPYDARYITPEGYVQKCTFCEHRIDKKHATACTEACPAKCINFGNLENPISTVSRLLRNKRNKTLIPEVGTKPQIYYLF